MTPKLITFDLDGILINSAGLHDEAFVGALKDLGLAQARTKYAEQYGIGAAMESVSTRQKCELLGLSEYYDDIKEAKDKVFNENLGRIEFCPWVGYDLARLADKCAVAVVTNCTETMAYVICDLIGLTDRKIVPVFAATNGIATKPDPALYHKCTRELGHRPGDPWLAIEDSDNGAKAAQAAGATKVVKTTYHETKERLRLCAF